MKNYEILSKNCKIAWREAAEIGNAKYTQGSGYVLNEQGQLLIVKNQNTWTIPGGHPEAGETKEETLKRELMEEACITLKDIHYLGAVEVVENGETYYQLRYTAKVNELLPFQQEWEICERKFVDFADLSKYIIWANGKTFAKQIESVKNFWGN